MAPQDSHDPFKKVRGTKSWVVERMIQPTSRRRLEMGTPPLIPPSFRRLLVMALPLIPIVACIFGLLWVGSTFLASSDTASITPSFTETPASQPILADVTPRPPVPTQTVGAKAGITPTSIPSPTATRTLIPPPTPSPAPVKYKVKQGDTLLGIALKNGVTVDALKEANGLTSDAIHIGDELIIPPKPK